MARGISPDFRPIGGLPVKQPSLMTTDDEIIDSCFFHNLRHLQRAPRHIHIEVRQSLISVEVFFQPTCSQIKLSCQRLSGIHFFVRLNKSTANTDTSFLYIFIEQRLRFGMPVQILHHNRSLLDIHLKGRVFLQTLQERSQPQCITVCNTRINMIQPGQILMCGRKQINTPLSKL